MTQVSKPSDVYGRIKAYAQVYQVDTTSLDDEVLTFILRVAKANEWALVDDKFKTIKEGR